MLWRQEGAIRTVADSDAIEHLTATGIELMAVFSTEVEDNPSADANRRQQAHPFENRHRPGASG